jgi:hypothetical protein
LQTRQPLGDSSAILLRVSRGSDVEDEGAARRVSVRLPPWLGGNNILQSVEEAGLKATSVDASTYRWQLETQESYQHHSPRPMTIEELAGPGQPPRWDRLRTVADPGIPSPMPRERLFAERDRIIRERPGDFAAYAAALKLVVSTIDHAEMPVAAREGYELLASGEGPPITGVHTGAATTWWAMQMSKLLSELSDFSNYCNGAGTFVPRCLFETFMSVEQVGRRLQGIFAHDRDLATRRAVAFDAFDTLKGLGIIELFEGCKLSRAERTLASLEDELPTQAGELLLLPARRAVQALRSLQTGFLPSRTTGGVVRLPDRRESTATGQLTKQSLSTCSCCGTQTTASHRSRTRMNAGTSSCSWPTTAASRETLPSCRTSTGWTLSRTPIACAPGYTPAA